jgi:aryl-alcohol dehydrogenase-like predicted oxidoreductase
VLLLGWNNWYPSKKILREALALKESGLIHFIAMSGHNRKLFGSIAQQSDSPIDIFMVRYNAAHRGAEEEIFPHLPRKKRPGITIYTATRWGKLLNPKKMPPGEKPLTASDCYRFVLSNPFVDLCMMGPATEREMEEGMTALKKGPLSKSEMERIKKIGDYVHG